ncbi:class I SAM-dependent methyltransferase [Rhizobium sp. 16-449-1b]|uniref:class I SAM-dependent DNA methyltransferase n=1 Tax=Rhizobium sp. 16-449-1b TaxID=2819989 RepID=UPI001ADCF041|nr:class I SAM-dependent methyltransferase [Rhizobium sp. 16-449-1b]MBO9193440.1 class I SAM-dependent methyltransferase [Rhizobium sp. 16-449-1b]
MSNGGQPGLYDDPALFSAYEAMRQRAGRLNEVVEEPAVLSLLPDVAGADVADLGCGAGAMGRKLVALGAASVLGIDSSQRMLEQAKQHGPALKQLAFKQQSLEDLQLPELGFDVILSSLALHYVGNFERLVDIIYRALKPKGCLIFSVEHPIVTCHTREWITGDDGVRQAWPVDRYGEEGHRDARWLELTVPREHRTVASYINGLLDAGFSITRLLEPMPDQADIDRWPRLADQRRRPPFLVVRADKT